MHFILLALILFISPTGNDDNPGTRAKPFATLDRARAAKPDIVEIRGGRYPITQTFHLTAQDSNTIYRAARGERPIFTGGLRLRNFRPGKNSKLVTVDIDKELSPFVLGGFGSRRGFKTHSTIELFFNGKALPLARWPNEGFAKVAGATNGQLTVQSDRLTRWLTEPDLWLYGYWYWDWADSYERVAGINPDQHEITLAPPLHTYGFRAGQPFIALNALSELDAPGEWYLDRKANRLYLYPPSSLFMADVELSTLPVPFVEINSARNIRFEGLTWEYGSADGVIVHNGSNVTFTGCTIRHCAGNGLDIRGGNDHTVQSCHIHSLGRGGIILTGGDRATLHPGNHLVENCEIHNLSRIDHTYTPGILVSGVGHRVRHNLLHHIASSALRVGGNDHLIEYNEIHHVVLESDDQGGVDMWGDPTFRGIVYRYNYFHDIGSPDIKLGQAGIRLDDAISGMLIQSNLFERCGGGKHEFGAIQIHGGKDNIVANNVFRDCPTAISFSPWSEDRWLKFIEPALAATNALWVARYPDLAKMQHAINANFIRSNQVINCRAFLRRDKRFARCSDNLVTTNTANRFILPEKPGLYRSR